MSSTKIIGRQSQIGIGKESSRGTVHAVTYWVPFNDLTIDQKIESVFDAQAYGIIEDSVGMYVTKEWAAGTITANLYDHSFGLILYSLLGTLTSHNEHSGETTVYDNIFNVAESTQHQSLTFGFHDPGSGQDYAFPNGIISKLEINFALKQFIQYTATLIAQKGTTESSYTPSTTTENVFLPQNLTLSFASSDYAVKSAKITIDQNIESQDVLGSTSPADFLTKEFHVEWQFEIILNGNTFVTDLLAGTSGDLNFTVANSAVTIGSATSPTLILDMPQSYITDVSTPRKVKDLVYQTIKGRSVYSTGSSYMLECTLTNTVNGY
jgi:Phage tail tube protein